MKKNTFLTAVLMLTAVLAFSALQAQVTYETVTTTDGIMGMGAATSTVKTSIQGDARRQESQMQFTGSIMKHMSPKGTEIEITRLDKELIWKFNDKDKKYTEMTFAEYKKMMEEALKGFPQEQKREKEEGKPEYEWQTPIVKAQNLNEKQTINNFACNHYLVTVTTIGKQLATGKLDTLVLSADMFNSINVGKAMKQISDFDLRLAQALGLDEMKKLAGPLAAQYGDQMKKLAEEMKKVEGYPVRTEMVFSMTRHSMPEKSRDDQEVAGEEKEEPQTTDVRDVKGALGGMFGKKMKEMAKARADKSKENKASGDEKKKGFFHTTTELKSITVGAVASEQFEVPAGYQLQKNKSN
ncbi:MAG TPA: hypothetical protein PLN61_10965 [bacterium]|nr:hypothetical protein [bacterium]HQI49170.1 hypothetical protein [bacterium]HQJ65000.1 hypothetical protein [bacterium]